jgi:hypothetical protein
MRNDTESTRFLRHDAAQYLTARAIREGRTVAALVSREAKQRAS